MNTILITGANGQLGSELRVIEKGFAGMQCLFHDVDTLDITNASAVEKFFIDHKPTYVINCAAYTAVDKAESDQEKARAINVSAVEILVDACRRHSAYLIHISTDYVFDGKSTVPYTEDMAVNPISAYGKTKELGERVVRDYEKGLIVRTSWLYSCFGNNIVKTILRLSNERPEISFITDQSGCPTYAADLALAGQTIVNHIDKKSRKFVRGIYHYSNEGSCTWFEFAQTIVSLTGRSCKVNPILTRDYPTPAVRPAYSVFDKNKIKQTWNVAVPGWLDGLKRCLEKMK